MFAVKGVGWLGSCCYTLLFILLDTRFRLLCLLNIFNQLEWEIWYTQSPVKYNFCLFFVLRLSVIILYFSNQLHIEAYFNQQEVV
jgi:hypothetical protein